MKIKNRLNLGLVIVLSSLLWACGGEASTPLTLSTTPTSSVAATPTSTSLANLEPPLVKKWEYRTAKPDVMVRMLQLSPDNQTAFVLETNQTGGAEILALTLSSGQVKWRVDISALVYDKTSFFQIFTLADNTTLYVTPLRSSGGLLMALDAGSGAKKWEFKVDPALTFLSGTIESQGESLFVAFESPDTSEVLFDKVRTSYLVSVNKKSGAKNWEFKTDNTEYVRRVKASTPGTYLSSSSTLLYLRAVDTLLYGVEPTTGKVTWKLEQSQTTNARLLNAYKDGGLLLISDPPDFTKWTLRAIAVKDGATLWNVPLTTQKNEFAAQGYFFVGENTLYLVSMPPGMQNGTITSIDLSKGALKWNYTDLRIAQPGPSKDSNFVMANQSYVYAFSIAKPGLLVLDAATGKLVWQRDDSDYYGLAATKDTLYTANKDKLLGFSLATGNQSWSADLSPNSRVTYRIQTAGNLLLFGLNTGMVAYGRA